MYDLKIDKELPHHYLIGVEMYPITAGDQAGKIHLKYGPLYFHNNDVNKLRDALILSNDKLFPTSQTEALDIYEVAALVNNISSMRLACKANLATIHHFSSVAIMNEEAFLKIVDLANKTEQGRTLLNDSKIY